MNHFTMRKRKNQVIAALIAAGVLGAGLIGHGARAEDGGFAPTFEGETPAAVGMLVIPGKAKTRAPGASIGREEIYRLKMERWERERSFIDAQGDRDTDTAAEPWYTERELELLACTVYCEAGSDTISDETRMMVAQVVINRVNDDRYPDTIEEVLTQRSQYGRFHWTGVVWPSRAEREPEAVERAYNCAKRVLNGEWLLPSDVVFQAEFRQGSECVVHVPGFYFCR